MHVLDVERGVDLPFGPRGALSDAIIAVLAGEDGRSSAELPELAAAAVEGVDAIRDDDVQLSLFLLYALAYGSLDQVGAEWEWDPDLIRTRTVLETAFERALREQVPMPELPEATADAVAAKLFELTAPTPGPSLSRYLAKQATLEQVHEFLVQRSIYTLREADAHSWVIPRLTGRPKAALIEIQADEYGGGRAERMHQAIYAQTLRGVGLDDDYGAYVDHVPAITLASFNLMTMFGLNRRLRGAAIGHLAAFEMTSSIPCRFYGDGLRRHGFGEDVTWYYDEHVEADAVHEQIAGRDLAGSLAEDDPRLLADILFGAQCCLTVDGWAGDHVLEAFERGESSAASADRAPGGAMIDDDETTITPYPDGPLLVRGKVRLQAPDGTELEQHRSTVALCRCGVSMIKPFCDGTHKLVGFKTTPPPADS